MFKKFNYKPDLSRINDYEYYWQLEESNDFQKLFKRCVYDSHIGDTDCDLDDDGYLWIDWCPSDSEEVFLHNKSNPETRQLLVEHGWLDKDFNVINNFRYRLNSEFFRSNHFENKSSLVTMGCSFTFGIGLPERSLWCTKLAEHMGLELYNLASPGKSLTISAYYFLENYKRLFTNCKAIAILTPPPYRIDLTTVPRKTDGHFSSLSDLLSDPEKELMDLDMRDHVIMNSLFTSGYYYERLAMNSIRYLAEHNNIQLMYVRPDQPTKKMVICNDLARDLEHQGEDWQTSIYEEFLAKYNHLA